MSEEFEVKGLHEEVLEGHETPTGIDNKLAVMTALMACMGALLSYEASLTLGQAILYKNEASIRKTEATDIWNHYQAKSGKQNIAELAAKLTSGVDRDNSLDDVKRYETEKETLKPQADHLDQLAREADKTSEHYMHQHHQWATGTTVMQIAISLAAIALLTRRRWLAWASYLSAAAGVGMGLFTLLGV
jgi:Domain of unknown function (DUF4337)